MQTVNVVQKALRQPIVQILEHPLRFVRNHQTILNVQVSAALHLTMFPAKDVLNVRIQANVQARPQLQFV